MRVDPSRIRIARLLLTPLVLTWLAIGSGHAGSQSGDIVGIPYVHVQDGDTAEIQNILATKKGWWSSFRIALGSDGYLPGPLTPDSSLLPQRLRVKDMFFAREIVMSGPKIGMLLEHPADSSRGLGGFPCNDLYYGADDLILRESSGDVHARPFRFFADLDAIVRSVLFDTVGSFGYQLLATTEAGSIYRIDKFGKAVLLARLDEDIKAADIVPLDPEFGPFAGQMIFVSRFLGKVRSINSSGVVTELDAGRNFPGAEGLFILPKRIDAASTTETTPYLLHWPMQMQHPYTEQVLTIEAYAILAVLRRERWEIWALQRNGSHFEAKPLVYFSRKVDEITFLTPARLPPGGACPDLPPSVVSNK
jgi:hypothetical protein